MAHNSLEEWRRRSTAFWVPGPARLFPHDVFGLDPFPERLNRLFVPDPFGIIDRVELEHRDTGSSDIEVEIGIGVC